ncbi:MAG TPA: peptidase M61 [Candidatus Dormibacteraeota bacterium]|nr:peptidase M61 [Candidatus Dormibacteraeota bacterium]
MYRFRRYAVAALTAMVAIALTRPVWAQSSPGPEPVPLPPHIVAPADTPYPGTIALAVNLTNTTDRVATVDETIPVNAAHITLLYPQWLPGDHAPEGPIQSVSGLFVSSNGQRIPWVRDRVNMYAFHVHVPEGTTSLDVKFDYLSPILPQDGNVSMSRVMADLSWNTVVLYPAGHFARDIHVTPTVVLPAGWKYATALETDSQEGDTVHFKQTTLNTLVDSPLVAGEYYRRVDLSTAPDNQVFLDVFADQEKDLKITPKELQMHKNLAVQAQRLFDSHHYNHYDFLFTLSGTLYGKGLEHHQSSEDGTDANYFTDWNAGVRNRDLLAHEYTHSWNGKFRRPNDLWRPAFNMPEQDNLLWVYEGLTQYWGYVLTARAGMRTPEQTRDLFADIAANFEVQAGREWRPLEDSTNQEILSERRPVSWVSWQRNESYYNEGLLIWLDVDTKIRELSAGKKSLDNFAKAFYGIDNGSFVTVTYDFNDIVTALNKVQPYDWAKFLRTRIYELHPEVPLGGFTQGGYKLVYNDTPPSWEKHGSSRGSISFAPSIGFYVRHDGTISSVQWDSPAFRAGLTPGTQILAVNGQAWGGGDDANGGGSDTLLKDAILQAEHSSSPIQLVVKDDSAVSNVTVDYHGGLRYPHLERVQSAPDRLDPILAPVK